MFEVPEKEIDEIKIPSFVEFRQMVNSLPNCKETIGIKMAYLTAARRSEITTKCPKSEIKRGRAYPYGKHMTAEIKTFRKKEFKEKVLVIRTPIAKRSKKKMKFKRIGLPTSPIFEPWVTDLLLWIKLTGDIKLKISARTLDNWVKWGLRRYIPDIHAHSLRHYRTQHLIDIYQFEGLDLMPYMGWAAKTMLGSAAGQLDTYGHLSWRKYFLKLCVPLNEVL